MPFIAKCKCCVGLNFFIRCLSGLHILVFGACRRWGVYRSESGCDAVNGGSYHGVITAISRKDSTKCGSDKPVWSRRSRGKFGVLRLAPFRVLTDLELSIPPRLAAASLLWLFCLPSSPCRSLPSIPPTFSHHGCKPLESPRYVNVNWRRCRLY